MGKSKRQILGKFKAAQIKIKSEIIEKIIALDFLILPSGISLFLVLGFLRSISASMILFMLIANDLAPIIARMIKIIVLGSEKPVSLNKSAPESANGRAKTECSNLIKLQNVANSFFMFLLICFQDTNKMILAQQLVKRIFLLIHLKTLKIF